MMSEYQQSVFPWNSTLLIDYQTCGTVRIIFIVNHLFAKLLPILTNKRNTDRPGPLGSDLSKKIAANSDQTNQIDTALLKTLEHKTI